MTEAHPEISAVEKLVKMLDEQKSDMFTEAEATALRKFANFLLALETLGSAGANIRRVLMWFGFMIGAWLAFKNGALEWLSHNLAK